MHSRWIFPFLCLLENFLASCYASTAQLEYGIGMGRLEVKGRYCCVFTKKSALKVAGSCIYYRPRSSAL